MKAAKQRYYEALDRQTAAERVLEKNLQMGGDTVQDRPAFTRDEGAPFQTMDVMYQELGVKAYTALTNFLDYLGRMGSGEGSRAVNLAALQEAVAGTLSASLARLLTELQEIKVRLEHNETRLAAIEAGLKRIDRYTIEAFRELEEMRRDAGDDREGPPAPERGRLAKEEAARLALEAGRRMHEQGKRLSLAAVAREAGLKYGQIVYAFGNKEAFFNELEKALAEESPSVDPAV